MQVTGIILCSYSLGYPGISACLKIKTKEEKKRQKKKSHLCENNYTPPPSLHELIQVLLVFPAVVWTKTPVSLPGIFCLRFSGRLQRGFLSIAEIRGAYSKNYLKLSRMPNWAFSRRNPAFENTGLYIVNQVRNSCLFGKC